MHGDMPSSLPSDCAILSRYAHARENADRDDQHDHDIYDPNGPTDTHGDTNPDRRLTRPTSLPSSYMPVIRVQLNVSESVPFDPKAFVSDEYTPLLVPRIEEEVDSSADPIHPQSTAQVYRDEFCVLFKYALPVFGYISPFCTPFST
jgi:MATE family multidrug resistance protein